MLYKKAAKKPDKIYIRNLIFIVLLGIYIGGLCAGCAFALKNEQNLSFVQKITFTSGFSALSQGINPAIDYSAIFRDTICILMLLLLKYSGILKGFTLTIPFIMAIQNGSIYTSLLNNSQISMLIITLTNVLRDSAVIFLVLIFSSIIVRDIIDEKENYKKDIRLSLVYGLSVVFIYMIDYSVKLFIYPGV